MYVVEWRTKARVDEERCRLERALAVNAIYARHVAAGMEHPNPSD